MPKKIAITVRESEKELRLLLGKVTTERIRGRIKALLLLSAWSEITII